MSGLAFRFVAALPEAEADEQFWRDVEASERLPTSASAAFFLRELCRWKAIEDISPVLSNADVDHLRAREASLIEAVKQRGYQVGVHA